MGEGFADLINQSLKEYQLMAIRSTDERLITKVKGQGVYFLLIKNGEPISSLIMT